MTRIKTSNILIISAVLLILLYGLVIIFTGYRLLTKYQGKSNAEFNMTSATNSIKLPQFSTLIVSGQNAVKITGSQDYKIASSSTMISYKTRNDTLWTESSVYISAPRIKTIITTDQAVVHAKIHEDSLNIISHGKSKVIIRDSKISYIKAACDNNSKFSLINSPTQTLSILLGSYAKAVLLSPIDTLTGQTGENTSITIPSVKFRDININGKMTKVEITHSYSPFQIEIENH